MLLVVLIPRYKIVNVKETRWPSHKEKTERKRKRREQERVEGCSKRFLRKRKRGRKNLRDGRLILA